MTDLHYALIALAVAVIAVVYGYNVWQEQRFRRKTAESFRQNQSDPLLDTPNHQVRDGSAERLEPSLLADDDAPRESLTAFSATDAEPVAAPRDSLPDDDAPLPELDEASEPRLAQQPAVPQTEEVESPLPDLADEPAPLVAEDPQEPSFDAEPVVSAINGADRQALIVSMLEPTLDFIAEVAFSPAATLQAWPRIDAQRRIQVIARSAQGEWLVANGAPPATPVSHVHIGLQLVDRGGAVSEAEIGQFVDQVEDFAAHHGGLVTLPQSQPTLAAARELDRFCADVDVLINLNLIAHKPFYGTKLRSLAEAHGMHLEADGRFHYLSESGNSLYCLSSGDDRPFSLQDLLEKRYSRISLVFDVPRVAGSADVFERAVAFSRQLAQLLDAELVDDARRPLSDASLAVIRQQLAQIHSRMDDRGIAPGSIAALRLFA
ncbi:cell division protein ZipA C-terminal FtsZ-binding domain-containing protein [Microvirgula aerodenitrificans]|uniref:cell division protein ZipA C-terminal FtsZ-binding domain-containing protein n=1 Tax=Microvirgula aerodenitrificans TaxID=57480 RepID=UPI000490E90F|nr:cell division protein ZipA C-terminal FtsZ-binding domain-containing protein [Microvirgula aerodenitrificans]